MSEVENRSSSRSTVAWITVAIVAVLLLGILFFCVGGMFFWTLSPSTSPTTVKITSTEVPASAPAPPPASATGGAPAPEPVKR